MQVYSIYNFHHPTVFCGIRASQFVNTATWHCNHRKNVCFILFWKAGGCSCYRFCHKYYFLNWWSNKHTIKSLRFFLITNWDGGDYNLRSTHAAKHIWVVVIRNWGGLPSLPLYREYVSGRLPHPQALDGHLGNLIINRKLYRGKDIDRSKIDRWIIRVRFKIIT